MSRQSGPRESGIRLQKILSHAGVASRRKAEELIRQGRVEVNRQVVTELGTKADPAHDDIRVDGSRLRREAPTRRHLLLYKPVKVVSTRVDPQHRMTVIDILRRAGIEGYFYPVGRLDYESEGLIILTNDGDFAEQVSHPRYEMDRAYEASVLGVPDARDISRLSAGLMIDGKRTLPARVRVLGTKGTGDKVETALEFVLREGRNRQVRRMCDAIGHPVTRLRRTRIGKLTAKGLNPGDIRELSKEEISALTSKAVSASVTAKRGQRTRRT